MIQIVEARTLKNFRLKLKLSNGQTVERDFSEYVKTAPGVLSVLRTNFNSVRVEDGAVVWGKNVDLCPDGIVWGGCGSKRAGRAAAKAKLLKSGRLKEVV